ncbi:unnamed protein product [Penicillium salamii]|nr:unnamed protein product [Penicillium salamii]CAG8174816.1 unnamed protein product [Penicillium salamii]CAG8367894.1 unnamed protein product [Penicillium salamii]
MAPKRKRAVARGSTLRSAVTCTANVEKKLGLAMSDPTEAGSRAKTPRKSASSRGKWSEDQLLASDKSALIDMDLVKLLAHPGAWNCLEETEKREILALLPPDVHPEAQIVTEDSDAKIPPIPDSFVRYSNNWRDGVRQFQLDLQNGRYDPKWLRQAQEARERRAEGAYDAFKEREYEQFWGQKQRAAWKASAGESARVKLGTLIKEGVIQLGDVWKFYFVYGKGADRLVIDKETRIDAIDRAKLTFAVPPGQKAFLHSKFDGDRKQSTPKKEDIKIDTQTESTPVTASSSHDTAPVEKKKSPVVTVSSNSDESPKGKPADSHPVLTPNSNEQKPEDVPDFSVVIVSPAKVRTPKRTISVPEPQPSAKRLRGRPRNNSQDPGSVLVSGSDERSGPSNDEQPGLASPVTMQLNLTRETENNAQLAIDPSQPKCASQDGTSPLSSPLSTPPESLKDPDEFASSPVKNVTVGTPKGNDDPSVSEAPVPAPTQSDDYPPIIPTEEIIKVDHALCHDPTKVVIEDEHDVSIPPAAAETQASETPTSSQATPDFPTNEEGEVIISNIATPQALVQKILQIDGRKPNGRTSNAWKELRCFRNNQDMGSLFDVRENWFVQHEND